MANSRSSLKRDRQNKVRRARNRVVRSKTSTFTNRFKRALDAQDLDVAEQTFAKATVELDRAASKGVIPKKRASRRISRMAQRLNELRAL